MIVAKMVRFRPGKLAYLSESDDEVETKQCAASSKRESPHTPALSNCQISDIRSSERIRRKQSQSFEKPTRLQLLSKIETLKSPSKMLDHLKPRRLVNDFTKERNRYNYDPEYTSGESSIDDFIVDDDDPGSNVCSSSEESNVAEETPSTPVPQMKSLISSSDDDQTPTKGKESNVAKRKFTKTKAKGAKTCDKIPSDSDDEPLNISNKSRTARTSVSKGNLSDSNDDIVNSSKKVRAILSSSDADSSGSDVVQPGQHSNLKRRKGSTKTESPQSSSSNDDSIMAPKHGAKRKLCMLSESSETSDANPDNQDETSSDCTDEESDDENGNGSEANKHSSLHNKISSRYGHFHSPRAKLMQRKRDKKRRLFSKLIQTRKRKNSNGNFSAV